MAFWEGVKRQLRSVIEWEDASPENLFAAWTKNGDEIKNCSKLIVKPGQGVVFLYEGKVEGVHLNEGIYDLQTANIPFWTTITKFMQSFESEHKVGIYFFWQTEFLNQKWGTTTPIKYDDPVYQFPVGLRAYGNFSFRISDAERFFVNVVGSRDTYAVDEIRRVLVERFVQQLTDVFAEAGHSYAEVDKNRDELAAALTDKVSPDFGKLGFTMTDFRIQGTDFDPETVARIAKIADMTAEAEAARRAGLDYAQVQQLHALRDAARNEGGFAGAGVGLGAGFGLGHAMMGAMAGAPGVMGQQQAQPPQQTQPPAQAATAGPDDMAARLQKLKNMFDAQLITEQEYEKKKAEILSEL